MNYLMKQLEDPEQIRGREDRLRVKYDAEKIAYKAPNGMVFVIDTSPINEGGEAVVTTKEAEGYPASHETHTFGDGRICLAESIRGWELTQILFQCDSWARGLELYEETGIFPDDPLEAFTS